MLATWGSSSGLNALLASSSLSLNFSNGSYTLGGVPYAVASVPGYSFTRSSGGYAQNLDGSLTYFAGTRTNLNLQSQTLDVSPWGLGNTTVTPNLITAPDGTSTADFLKEDTSTSTHYISQFTPASATAYSISIYVKAGTRSKILFSGGGFAGQGFSAVFDLSNGTMFSNSGSKGTITSAGNGWYRCNVTFTTSNTVVFAWNMCDASGSGTYTGDGVSGLYLWGAQVETTTNSLLTYPTAYIPTTTAAVSVDTPRITDKGFLSEEARTNLVLQSQNFENASWLQNTLPVITANALTAPDGTLTADLWTRTSTASSSGYQIFNKSASAITYTQSFFVKKSVGNYFAVRFQGTFPSRADVTFNLATGTISSAATATSTFTNASATITPSVNGYYRITLTATSDTALSIILYFSFLSTNGAIDSVDTASNSAGYLWGAQVEQAAFATSYIPTTTAAATRASDVMNYSGISPTAALTMAAQWIPNVITNDTARRLFYWQNSSTGTWNDFIGLFQSNSSLAVESFSAGSLIFSVYGSPLTVNNLQKTALSVTVGKSSLALNGTISQTTTSVSTIPTLNSVEIGNHRSTSGGILNGYVKLATIYPIALTDAQLQAITT